MQMQTAMEKIKEAATEIYAKYLLAEIQACAPPPVPLTKAIARPHLWLLAVSVLLVIAAFISACSVCCLHQRY